MTAPGNSWHMRDGNAARKTRSKVGTLARGVAHPPDNRGSGEGKRHELADGNAGLGQSSFPQGSASGEASSLANCDDQTNDQHGGRGRYARGDLRRPEGAGSSRVTASSNVIRLALDDHLQDDLAARIAKLERQGDDDA